MTETFPRPMLSGEFVDDFVAHAETAEAGDTVGITTMQIAAQVEPDKSLISPSSKALLPQKNAVPPQKYVSMVVTYEE